MQKDDDAATALEPKSVEQLLAAIGEVAVEPVQPSLKRPQRPRQDRFPTLAAVEALVGSGMLRPEQLRLLDWVQLADDALVRGDRLRWHQGIRQVVYQSPNGGFVDLSRTVRALTLGGDEEGWTPVFANPDANVLADAAAGIVTEIVSMKRFSVELGCGVTVAQLAPTIWQARCDRGEFNLIDLSTGQPPLFDDVDDAVAAAQSALLGEGKRWRWIANSVPHWVIDPDPNLVR